MTVYEQREKSIQNLATESKKSIEEAKFTGKGDEKKVRGAALVLGPHVHSADHRFALRHGYCPEYIKSGLLS